MLLLSNRLWGVFPEKSLGLWSALNDPDESIALAIGEERLFKIKASKRPDRKMAPNQDFIWGQTP